MPSAALYARISRDRLGARAGVDRQEQDCRAYAEKRGWTVTEVYVDNDLEAYSGKARPGYQAMFAAAEAGQVDAILAWHNDRLHRRPSELEEFISLVERKRIAVAVVEGGDYDLSTPDGRLAARIVGAVARKESEDKARRLKRKHQELAEQGRWKGGISPYGYRLCDGGLEVVPEEASIIAEIARRTLAGESPYMLCLDLERRQIPTRKGGSWRPPTLRGILTSPTIAGRRVYRGEVVGDAQWPAIIDDTTARRLVAQIKDPSRHRAKPARAYLLTGGVARCGPCGKPLHAQKKKDARAYVCAVGAEKGGCGGISIRADPLEEIVAETVMVALETPALVLGVDNDVDEDEVSALEARLDELAVEWANGLPRRQWLKARSVLEVRLAEAQHRVLRASNRAALVPYSGVDVLRSAWPTLDLGQRRAVVGSVVDRVVVSPVTRRGPRFDPSRVRIEPRL